jgi:hypothetical protein
MLFRNRTTRSTASIEATRPLISKFVHREQRTEVSNPPAFTPNNIERAGSPINGLILEPLALTQSPESALFSDYGRADAHRDIAMPPQPSEALLPSPSPDPTTPLQDPANSRLDFPIAPDVDVAQAITPSEQKAPLSRLMVEDLHDVNTKRRKLRDAFERLADLRLSVLGLRVRVQEGRTALRNERDTMNTQDAELIQKLRVTYANRDINGLQYLLSDFERIQESRNSFSPKEDDHDKLEDQLNREEFDLMGLESKIYRRNVSAQISLLDEQDLVFLEDNFGSSDSTLSTHSGPAQLSPQLHKYLSRKGDADVLRERLAELRAERAQLIEEEVVRAQVGLGLDSPSRTFLSEFDARHSALQQQLANVEEDVWRLKEALVEKEDVYFSSSQFEDWQTLDERAYHFTTENFSYQLGAETSDVKGESDIHDPLLLPDDDSRAVFSQSNDNSDAEAISTESYINQWLLHQLRRSSREVRRFKSAEVFSHLHLSKEQIKDLVLELWSRDSSIVDFVSSQKLAAQSLNLSVQTTRGRPPYRATYSDSALPTIQDAVLKARRGSFGEGHKHAQSMLEHILKISSRTSQADDSHAES